MDDKQDTALLGGCWCLSVASLYDPPCGKGEKYLIPGQFNVRIGIAFFSGIDKFGIGACYKNLNPKKYLPFNFFIQKYSFHDYPTCNINYSNYVLQVVNKSSR